MEDEIVNKVARSGVVSLDLAHYYHSGNRIQLDIKDWLFQNIVLKEKDFRDSINAHNWGIYQGNNVAIHCSEDVIIPTWAYMLIASKLESVAFHFVFGDLEDLEKSLFQRILSEIDYTQFEEKRVIVKGCGDIQIPDTVYVELVRKLKPYASSIMFGEPCSTVPIFKKLRQ